MNRRDFLKSLAGAAVAIGLPLPEFAVVDDTGAIVDVVDDAPISATISDEIVNFTCTFKPRYGEHWTFGSPETQTTYRFYDIELTRYAVDEHGVQYLSKSYYAGDTAPTFEWGERVKNGDFSGFYEYERLYSVSSWV